MDARYSIDDLARRAGVSRRTVRFYVQRGLLAPPIGLGRGAHYTAAHLAVVLQIKAWQESGRSLEGVALLLRGGEAAAGEPAPHPGRPGAAAPFPTVSTPGRSWLRQPLAPGYELHVASDQPPLTADQLRQLASALTQTLTQGGDP